MSDITDETTEDSGLSEEVDTSTNEETQDTESSLEEDDFSFDDDDDTEESDESTEDEAATDSDEETEEESADDVKDEESKEADTAPADDVKKHNDEMAKKRIAEREAKQLARQKQQEDYLGEAKDDPTELAIRELRIDAYNNRVDSNINKLENGLDKAVANIDLLTKGTTEQKEALAEAYDDFLRMYVKADANGDPIDVTADVYQFLQSKAESIRRLTSVGVRQETKAKSNAKARTDTIPTRTPKVAKVDPDLAAFDEEASR